jgi:hypothetical protein
MSVNRLLLLLSLLLTAAATHAQETSDWKLLGFQAAKKAKEEPPAMFYLASEIKRSPTGNVQVWTKTFSGQKLTTVMNTRPSDALTASVKEKVQSSYQPPYVTLRKSGENERLMVIAMEALADSNLAAPDIKMLWEFNCAESTYRILSAISEDGQSSSSFVWQPVPPETLIHDLATLTCKPAQK